MNQHCEFDAIKKYRKNFMKPLKNSTFEHELTCRMNTKDKNLWIIGTEKKLEQFIYNAIGDSWLHIYNKDNSQYWDGYMNQPFIVFRLYHKRNRRQKIVQLKEAGDWCPTVVNVRWSSGELNPNSYHCIILSIFTPEEYCKGLYNEENEIKSLKWRYDELKL